MNKLLVSLLLTLGVAGTAQAAATALVGDAAAGQAYDDLVARFLGEERPFRHIEAKPKGWLARLFGA